MIKIVFSFVGSVTVVAWTATADSGVEKSQAVLEKQATVTEVQARDMALAKVLKGTIKSSELEKENRKLIWSFDIATPGTRNITEVQIDARTGKVVAIQIESPAEQGKEAQSEK